MSSAAVGKEQSLKKANEAHRPTVATVVAAVGAEVRAAEAHEPCVAAIAVRRRPVVAVRTDSADRSPEPDDRSPAPDARGWQEDRTMALQCRPLGGTDGVAAKVRTTRVGVAQRRIGGVPVVGQQDHAVHVVHLGLGVTDAARRVSGVEHFYQSTNSDRWRMPLRVTTRSRYIPPEHPLRSMTWESE